MNWNETKSKREVEQEDRARISNESVAKEQYTDNSERRDKRDSQYCDNIMQTRIAPHASVEPKNIEQEYFDTQKQGKQFCKLPQSSPVKQNGFETNCVSQEVREYDKKNNSEFLETLRIFLEENEDIVATCKRLFIHRNTLAYRLKRIEEITNRSMAEAESRLDFRIAFKICLYLQLVDNEK